MQIDDLWMQGPGFTQQPRYPNAIISFAEFNLNMYLFGHSHFHYTLQI